MGMNNKLVPLLATFSLAACIPPGSGDYRIGTAEAPINNVAAVPQMVPEQAIIADTPSWSPAVVERNAQLVERQDYLVQAGDTLYRIEAKTGAGLSQIAIANDLSPPYSVRLGQRLTIPGGLYHRVGSGETGIAIARAYGASWADIVTLNGLQQPYIIRQGQRLRLPDSASAVPISGDFSPEQRADAFSLNIDDIVTGGEPALAETGMAAIAKPGIFAGAFIWPLRGTILSRFGSQGGGKVNDGLNIAGPNDMAVGSAADGVVVYSGNEIGVFGGLVLVDHGSGWVTAYGHLGRLDVKRGDKVQAGQSLGGVGETGYVTQPQLHFEIRKDRKPLDPMTKLGA
jgi:murein DD-endopeptidase MepM/ murein hydrolase activator NlpD